MTKEPLYLYGGVCAENRVRVETCCAGPEWIKQEGPCLRVSHCVHTRALVSDLSRSEHVLSVRIEVPSNSPREPQRSA